MFKNIFQVAVFIHILVCLDSTAEFKSLIKIVSHRGGLITNFD